MPTDRDEAMRVARAYQAHNLRGGGPLVEEHVRNAELLARALIEAEEEHDVLVNAVIEGPLKGKTSHDTIIALRAELTAAVAQRDAQIFAKHRAEEALATLTAELATAQAERDGVVSLLDEIDRALLMDVDCEGVRRDRLRLHGDGEGARYPERHEVIAEIIEERRQADAEADERGAERDEAIGWRDGYFQKWMSAFAERDSLRAELDHLNAAHTEVCIQRVSLMRDVDRLRADLAAAQAERDEARRHQSETLGNFDALSFEYERDTARLTAERDAARREVEGMRAVVEAVREWRAVVDDPNPEADDDGALQALDRALDALATPGRAR